MADKALASLPDEALYSELKSRGYAVCLVMPGDLPERQQYNDAGGKVLWLAQNATFLENRLSENARHIIDDLIAMDA